MLGRLVLCWYPKRKPSEEMRRTTGLWSLLRGRDTDLWKGWDFETWLRGFDGEEEEKKRKAKAEAAERAMQVTMRSDVKMKQLEMVLVVEEVSESLLLWLWRSAIDWLGGSLFGCGFFADNVSPEIIASLFSGRCFIGRKLQTLIGDSECCLNNLRSEREKRNVTTTWVGCFNFEYGSFWDSWAWSDLYIPFYTDPRFLLWTLVNLPRRPGECPPSD